MSQLISRKTVTARKSHRCRNCNATVIQPGSEYVRETYVYDGRIYDWVSCDPCEKLTPLVWEWWYRPDEGVGADEFLDWAHEHVDDPKHCDAAQAYLERFRGSEGGAS